MILHHYFMEEKAKEDPASLTERSSSLAQTYPGYLERGLIEFEQYIMIALVLTREFGLLESLVTNAYERYNFLDRSGDDAPHLRRNQNALPGYFLTYAWYKLGREAVSDPAEAWVQAIDNYTTTFDDYKYLILLNWFLVDYLHSTGERERALKFYEAALELTRFAGYDFYTALLLRNDPLQRSESLELAAEMIRNSGMNETLFHYSFGPSPAP